VTKHCTLHGVVDVARAIELLKGPCSDSSPNSATIVGCLYAYGNPHHFALVWSRARRPRVTSVTVGSHARAGRE
jgi:hypothetical protein